jgi:transposase
MTKYREILRLKSLNLSQQNIADSCNVSKKTVNRVLKRAAELGISWPLEENDTDAVLAEKFFPSAKQVTSHKRMPDYDYIRKELLRNGVSKKLLWTEYMEDCRANGDEPLMYSQFCYHIQQDEQKHPATIIDPDTGEIIKAYIFVGVMTYSQYAYVEAFLDMKQKSWINAHVHMYEYFGGVAKILVPDNCKTAVVHNGGWKDQQINETYQELAEHYGTAIIPSRVRAPKDKPNAEGTVGNISTWITAALRNEQFFSLAELNRAIRDKLELFNQRLFQKKEGSRRSLFLEEEKKIVSDYFIMGKQVKKIAEELGISTRQVSRDKNSALAKMLKRMKAAGYESYAEASGAFQQESDYIPTQMETQNSIMKKRTGEVRVPSDNKAKN